MRRALERLSPRTVANFRPGLRVLAEESEDLAAQAEE